MPIEHTLYTVDPILSGKHPENRNSVITPYPEKDYIEHKYWCIYSFQWETTELSYDYIDSNTISYLRMMTQGINKDDDALALKNIVDTYKRENNGELPAYVRKNDDVVVIQKRDAETGEWIDQRIQTPVNLVANIRRVKTMLKEIHNLQSPQDTYNINHVGEFKKGIYRLDVNLSDPDLDLMEYAYDWYYPNSHESGSKNAKYFQIIRMYRYSDFEAELPWHDAPWYVNGDATNGQPICPLGVNDKPTQIAFFATPEDCILGKYTTMTVGRFLRKYYKELTHDQIEAYCQQWALLHNVEYEVLTTSNEIVNAYENGPRSCMSDDASSFESCVHPTAVYGDRGDKGLHLVIVKRGGKITGRCLIYPEAKTYGTIYGDYARTGKTLAELGYKEGKFYGAELNKIESGGTYVAPYLDDCCYVRDAGDYFVIDNGGDIAFEQTNGLCEASLQCDECGDLYHEDDVSYINDMHICSSCCADNYTYCAEDYKYVHNDNCKEVVTRNGSIRNWTPSMLTAHAVVECAIIGKLYDLRYHTLVYIEDADEYVHDSKYGIKYDFCAITDEPFYISDLTKVEGVGLVCPDELEDALASIKESEAA